MSEEKTRTGIVRHCKECGAAFEVQRHSSRKAYCSSRCKDIAYRNAHREEIRAKRRKMPSPEIRHCKECGAEFEVQRHSSRMIYCSRNCNSAAWKKRHPEAVKETNRNWHSKHRAERKAYKAAHRKDWSVLREFWEITRQEKMASDPACYAKFRAYQRERSRRRWDGRRKGAYKPRPWMRIPDWATKGSDVLNRGSVFLTGNMSDEQIMANRAFVLEQNATEDRHRPRVKTIFRSC